MHYLYFYINLLSWTGKPKLGLREQTGFENFYTLIILLITILLLYHCVLLCQFTSTLGHGGGGSTTGYIRLIIGVDTDSKRLSAV
jgi:hypothetical protein